MKKLPLLVREIQWFGQKPVFLRVLEFYFFRVFYGELSQFSKNLTKNIKKKLIFGLRSSLNPIKDKKYKNIFELGFRRKR